MLFRFGGVGLVERSWLVRRSCERRVVGSGCSVDI